MTIVENIKNLEKDLRDYDALLLAVSKTHGIDKIKKAYDYGIRDFGENKVQELLGKKKQLEDDINWHLIGHLQSNKVNKIVGKVKLIHSVDSLKILRKINNRAKKLDIVQECLIQVNVSKEESKSGLYEEDLKDFFEKAKDFENVKIEGLMTMAPHTDDENLIRDCFKKLRKIFDNLSKISYNNTKMKYLSMGMTNDYKIALKEGANIIRVGSKIFGKRMYKNVW